MIACGSSHFHLNNFGNANERSRVIQVEISYFITLFQIYKKNKITHNYFQKYLFIEF